MIEAPNYDRDAFAVEFDNRPWIVGETSIGNHRLNTQPLPALDPDWLALTEDTSAVSWSQTLSVDDGLLTPRGTSCQVQTRDHETAALLIGAPLRVTYRDRVLWSGTARRSTLTLTPDERPSAEPIQARASIESSDWIEDLNRLTLYGFTAPQESTRERLARVAGMVEGVWVAPHVMPARDQTENTTTALALVTDALRLGQAYVRQDPDGTLTLATLASDTETPWELGTDDLTAVSLAADQDDTLTSVTITSRSNGLGDEPVTASAALPNPLWPRHAEVTLDCLPETGLGTAMEQILATWPLYDGAGHRLQGADLALTVENTDSDDSPVYIWAGALVDVEVGTFTASGVVTELTHTVTPTRWDLSLQLGPTELRSSYQDPRPDPVTDLVSSNPSNNVVRLDWTPVDTPNLLYTYNGGGFTSSYYFAIWELPSAYDPATPEDAGSAFERYAGVVATLDFLIWGPIPAGTWRVRVWSMTQQWGQWSEPVTVDVVVANPT